MIHLGFIGTGMIGRHHMRTFAALPDVTLAGAASRTVAAAERTAERFGVARIFATPEALLADPAIDAVVITAPNRWHEPLAVAALDAGKHVLLEKPMAIDPAAAARIGEAVARNGRVLLIAHQRRWTWPALHLQQQIGTGRLGTIYSARAVWCRRQGIPGWGGWFTSRTQSGGGALIDIGIHVLDLALWLMGDPEPVAVSGAAWGHLGARRIGVGEWGKPDWGGVFDVEDFATALVRLHNGATLFLEAGWAGHRSTDDEPFIGLMGSRAGAELYGETSGRLYFERDNDAVEEPFEAPRNDPGPFTRQAEHFLACIRGQATPVAGARSGWRNCRIVDAVYESARTGREVVL